MIKICAVTDIGLSREKNQDGFFVDGASAYTVSHKEIYYETDTRGFSTFVADGVGSTCDGEYAVEKLITLYNHETGTTVSELLNYINCKIHDDALAEGKQAATTIAGILVSDKVTVFNVGDSKVFELNNGYLDQKSIDDTMETLVLDAGFADDYLKQYGKSPLTQCLGNKKDLIDVHIMEIDSSNDFIICTDGLTDSLDLDEIEEAVCTEIDIRDKVKRLMDLAYKKGCKDNITIIYVSFGKEQDI